LTLLAVATLTASPGNAAAQEQATMVCNRDGVATAA
jgi:hypothetical protein